jgi:ANTAR domain
MSSSAPPRRFPPGHPAPQGSGQALATAPTPRTAQPPEIASSDGTPSAGSRAAGRFRYERGSDTWSWSPEMFAVLGLDPGTTDPGTETLVREQHPDDRARTLDAFRGACAGRAFALEVRSQGGQRSVVLVGEPQLDQEGQVTAVEGLCVDITSGRPPDSDGARAHELETEVAQLRAAMASRAVIEQAKGILMLLTSCRDQAAFDLLGHISSHTHRKVRDVARAITESAAGGARLPEEIRTILRDACPPAPHPP